MRRFCFAVPSFCIAISFASAQTPTAVSKPPDKARNGADRMEQIIQDSVAGKHFMGTVLVERDGKPILDKGYGSADLEWNIPNTPDTRFRLGSITKQFTAASILLLEERGQLKLDEPVSKYMPDARRRHGRPSPSSTC